MVGLGIAEDENDGDDEGDDEGGVDGIGDGPVAVAAASKFDSLSLLSRSSETCCVRSPSS